MDLAAAIILAAEEKKEGFNVILPQVGEIVWGVIAFVVLFVLLAKFAFPAIGDMIKKRSDTIESDLTKAEEAKLEAEQVLAEYRQQLASAREDAGRIIEEGRLTADALRKDVLAKAESQSQEIIEKGNRDVRAAVETARSDLQAQMSDLAIELAGRILGRELDAAVQRATIDEFLLEVEDLGAKS